MNSRQEAIKPVLPLKINGKTVHLNFRDYSNEIVEYRYKVSDFFSRSALDLLDTNNKYDAKEAHRVLSYINRSNHIIFDKTSENCLKYEIHEYQNK